MSKKDKGPLKKKALEQINQYFLEAGDNRSVKDANDKVRKARRLAMKFQIKLPAVLQRKFCKHCYSFLRPGVNLRVRTQKGHVVYYCLECKKFSRFPYNKK
jgi:ribonuclease P protein subunit RPR2